MAAFGREAGPAAASGGAKPLSIFPPKESSGGGTLPQTQGFGLLQNAHPAPHSSLLRATWVPEANERKSSPPPAYSSNSGYVRGFDHSTEFLSSRNPDPGGIRSPNFPYHYAHQPLRPSRPVVKPHRPGDSPYVWIKGQTPSVEKPNPGTNEVAASISVTNTRINNTTKSQNVKTPAVPPAKSEQISSFQKDTIQRPFLSPQKIVSIPLEEKMHSIEEKKHPVVLMNQVMHDSKNELKDYSRATVADSAHDIFNPAWSKNSKSITANDGISIKSSGKSNSKRTRSLLANDAEENLPSSMEFNEDDNSEREAQAKAKRLARFKQELNQDIVAGSHSAPRLIAEEEASMEEGDVPMDEVGELIDEHGLPESSIPDKVKIITGLCPHMCSESERGERERKGDLDQYERLDGDRNLSSKSLAVKKYNRTAEREAFLIRPMPVLQKTMEYLLHLLDLPYDDRFLGLYNFLWDRMRAIRMDLRMQHLFNLKAIKMLEQMIRLHIVAMHELCEYSKGEGFSEGFDAHLNIEQMNKTSVELFQMYDDHRNKGVHIPTEQEFRGYYALLKLDKHPGYKVDPGELSLDLSKMTQETRQTSEVIFARDVARACRTDNFTAFFRLARKATYLQACLMHAHFAKLRTVALAAIHSGLQMNQGLPVAHVAQWLVMEDEDTESLLDYHGFSIKEFEEPYMVKEGQFLNSDKDFPTKCSKLVHLKKSSKIMEDIMEVNLLTVAPDVEIRQEKSQIAVNTKPASVPPLSINMWTKTQSMVDEQMPDIDQTDTEMSKSPPQFSNSPTSQFSPGFPRIKTSGISSCSNSISIPSPKPNIVLKDPIFVHSLDKPPALAPLTSPRNLSRSNSDKKKSSPLSIMPTEKPFTEVSRKTVETHSVEEIRTIPATLIDFEETQIMDEGVPANLQEEEADDEVLVAKMKLAVRKWKRRVSKLKIQREQKLILSAAALDALTLGPSFNYSNKPKKPKNTEKLDIDHILSERFAKRKESWSRINICDVIGEILWAKNPHSDNLFWKLLLFSRHEEGNSVDINHWLRHKLMPSTYEEGKENVSYSSPSLSIWKKWFPNRSGCCVSFVRDATTSGEVTETFAGASGIIFPLSESLSVSSQKHHLNHLIGSLPSHASLPLVILASKSSPDPEDLDIDRSRISNIHIVHLVENEDEFLSDANLRDALRWLASRAPPQPDVLRVDSRWLVLSHLNHLLNDLNSYLDPHSCVSAFNKSLELTMKDVVLSAELNKTGWPCPEIRFLDGDVACHVSPGWSASNRIEDFVEDLKRYHLPGFSWANQALGSYSAIVDCKVKLQSDLANYLVGKCGVMGNLAAQEAHIMVQRCSDFSVEGSSYFVLPNWKLIFRRIFNWRVMGLSLDACVLRGVYDEMKEMLLKEEDCLVLQRPCLDEMIDVSVGRFPLGKSVNFERSFAAEERKDAVHPDGENLHVEERQELQQVPVKKVDRLSQLLERCGRIQSAIDRKLSIYF